MRIALVADAFPPMRSSAAVQLRDLARALAADGHAVTVMIPATSAGARFGEESDGAVEVLRLPAWRAKDVSWLRRTLAEFALPHLMWRALRRSGRAHDRFDAVVWYSPSIFLTPLIVRLKRANGARAYLIVRDLFPDWAADLGLMRRGPAFRVLRAVAARQFATADVIGMQSPGNLASVDRWRQRGKRVEVLDNWINPAPPGGAGIVLEGSPIEGRTIVAYAGNMGIAQGMDKIMRLIADSATRRDLGFLMVGRGSDAARLAAQARERGLDNVVFHDEIDPDRVSAVYAQAAIGLVALDHRHRTHNIPGKFIGYMEAGLPVLASVNPGNDLIGLIESADVGRASTNPEGADLAGMLATLLDGDALEAMSARARDLAERRFTAQAAARRIIAALSSY